MGFTSLSMLNSFFSCLFVFSVEASWPLVAPNTYEKDFVNFETQQLRSQDSGADAPGQKDVSCDTRQKEAGRRKHTNVSPEGTRAGGGLSSGRVFPAGRRATRPAAGTWGTGTRALSFARFPPQPTSRPNPLGPRAKSRRGSHTLTTGAAAPSLRARQAPRCLSRARQPRAARGSDLHASRPRRSPKPQLQECVPVAASPPEVTHGPVCVGKGLRRRHMLTHGGRRG